MKGEGEGGGVRRMTYKLTCDERDPRGARRRTAKGEKCIVDERLE